MDPLNRLAVSDDAVALTLIAPLADLTGGGVQFWCHHVHHFCCCPTNSIVETSLYNTNKVDIRIVVVVRHACSGELTRHSRTRNLRRTEFSQRAHRVMSRSGRDLNGEGCE
jgi:hypothetical protein